MPKAPHMKLRNCKRDAAAEIGLSLNLNPPDPTNRFLKQTREGPRSGSSRARMMAGLVDTAMCMERSNREHRLTRRGIPIGLNPDQKAMFCLCDSSIRPWQSVDNLKTIWVPLDAMPKPCCIMKTAHKFSCTKRPHAQGASGEYSIVDFIHIRHRLAGKRQRPDPLNRTNRNHALIPW